VDSAQVSTSRRIYKHNTATHRFDVSARIQQQLQRVNLACEGGPHGGRCAVIVARDVRRQAVLQQQPQHGQRARLGRQVHGRVAGLVRCARVRAGGQQHRHRVSVLARSVVQCRRAVLVARPGVCAQLQQRRHARRVAVRGGDVQRARQRLALLGIHVGAARSQRADTLLRASQRSHKQRRAAVLIARVHRGARVQQRCQRVQVCLVRCEMQRSEASFVRSLHRRTSGQQHAHNGRAALGCRPAERPARPAVAAVQVCACGDERRSNLLAFLDGRPHQCGGAPPVGAVLVSARVQQSLHNGHAAGARGNAQRRLARAVGGVGAGARLQRGAHARLVAGAHRDQQAAVRAGERHALRLRGATPPPTSGTAVAAAVR
jgi:hypothetical protein